MRHSSTVPVLLYFVVHSMGFGLLFLQRHGEGIMLLFGSSFVLICYLCDQTYKSLAVPAASPPVN